LVSANPVTIRQFSHALQELSLSNDVCQAAPEAIWMLNQRKFDAVIVDLQLGEAAGLILETVRLSPIFAESTICWRNTGHIGIRFVSLSQEHESELRGWLLRKLEDMVPEFTVAEVCDTKSPVCRNQGIGSRIKMCRGATLGKCFTQGSCETVTTWRPK
jgi:CheY-like chemotaxis protein